MADTTHTIGSTGVVKKLVDLGDGTYADAVADCNPALSTEVVVAGAASVLGKIGTIIDQETVYVRMPASAARDIEWRVKADVVHDVQKYKARSIVDSVTLTLAGLDDTNVITINGIDFTAEDTEIECLRSAYKFYTGGADDTADALDLAAAINVGKYILLTSANVADTVIVNGLTFTALGTAGTAALRQFDQSGTDAQDATALAARINHKATVTCASVLAAQTIIINGLTFTGGASEAVATRTFTRAGSDDDAATSLAVCINDATYGIPGVTASAGTNIVTLTMSAATTALVVTHGNVAAALTLAYVPAYGVTGVTAVARGKEVSLVKDFDSGVTFAATAGVGGVGGASRVVCGSYGIPGVTATPAAAVVTLTSTTATAIYACIGTGTTTGECAVSYAATLAALAKDGAAVTSIAANNTTAGTLYSQTMNGWEQGYLGITNKAGAAAVMTLVVGATAG